ncbi:HSP20 family protein [Natronocella acetinitrilica]|uniref:HSP20 family protein n=1 Tax=Natronocella acetinitrilica TaxID=414046 RepID=A0AAE3G156_9GAMM|nr:Hsp20/alpha crystallin family protein [Natronocella acetinitrilica]MCP1673268.1 HSP20 family protein [Natronocella acetinitrilica]
MFGQLTRFDGPLFNDLGRVLRLMDEAFGDVGHNDLRSTPWGAFPGINVGETEDAVRVYAFVPGLSNADIELSVEDGTLFIHGRRDLSDHTETASGWYRRERFRGEFTRAVRLPETVDPDQVEAQLANGVLSIQLRKREEMRPRKIEIQAA